MEVISKEMLLNLSNEDKLTLSALSINERYKRLKAEEISSVLGEIKPCTNLLALSLNLEYNNLNSSNLRELAQILSTFLHLQELKLSLGQCDFDDSSLGELGCKIAELRHLRRLDLDLQNNQISEEGISGLLSNLQNCNIETLQSFNLSLRACHKSGSKYLQELGKCFSLFVNLTSLTLNLLSCGLSNDYTDYLIHGIGKCKKLEELNLDLSFTIILNEKAILLANTLQQLEELKSLSLNLTNNLLLTNEVYVRIGESVATMKNIKKFEVQLFNNIGVNFEGVNGMLQNLARATTLEYLYLNLRQKIFGDIMVELTHCIDQQKRLKGFRANLYNSQQSSVHLNQLARSLGNCRNILYIDFNFRWNDSEQNHLTSFKTKVQKFRRLVTGKLELI